MHMCRIGGTTLHVHTVGLYYDSWMLHFALTKSSGMQARMLNESRNESLTSPTRLTTEANMLLTSTFDAQINETRLLEVIIWVKDARSVEINFKTS